MKWIKNNFKLFETEGDWALYLNYPVYKEINAYGDCYIFNTKTQEECGQHVELHCTLFDEFGNKLEKPIFEENCYQIIKRSTGEIL